jgi:hypothetical protein
MSKSGEGNKKENRGWSTLYSCHNEIQLYNKYLLIKVFEKIRINKHMNTTWNQKPSAQSRKLSTKWNDRL